MDQFGAIEGALIPYAGDPHDGATRTVRNADGTTRTVATVTPRGTRMEARNLPGGFDRLSRDRRCRFALYLVHALMSFGLDLTQALLFAAHICRETGYGASVVNYNFNNIRAYERTSAAWHRLSSGLPFRSYATRDEGLLAGLNLIRNNPIYADAWHRLLNHDASWYSAIGRAGYYGLSDPAQIAAAQNEYNGVFALISRCVGRSPSPAVTSAAIPSTIPVLIAVGLVGAAAWIAWKRYRNARKRHRS